MTEPAPRPTRPALSREYILRVALRLIDRDGLDALTMRRLGAELGSDPMAVYRHLPGKAELLDGVTEILWAEALDPAAFRPELPWREQAAGIMRRLRRVLLGHPQVLPLMGTHPLVTEGQYRLAEVALAALERGGLPLGPDALHLVNAVVAYALGHALAEAAEPAGGAGGRPDLEQAQRNLQRLPHLSAILSPWLSRGAGEMDAERGFETGLRALLDGWPEPGPASAAD